MAGVGSGYGGSKGWGLLARRQLRSSWGATLTLAAVALLAALVLSAAPRALADVHARQTAYATAGLPAATRDVVAVNAGRVPGAIGHGVTMTDGDPATTPPADPGWDVYLAGLQDLRDGQPEPLRSMLGEPSFQVTSSGQETVAPVEGSDLYRVSVAFRASLDIQDHVRVVDGRWPVATPAAPGGGRIISERDYESFSRAPFEVAVSRAVAERFGWEAGGSYPLPQLVGDDVRAGELGRSGAGPLVVAAVYEPLDPDDEYWEHHPSATGPFLENSPSFGLLGSATVYVDPAMIAPLSPVGADTRTWVPVSADGLAADEVPAVVSQLRRLDAQTVTIETGAGLGGPGGTAPFTVEPSTGLTGVVEDLLAQRSGVDAIVGVLAAGPLGGTVAVLALGARLVIDRRRTALALLRARGASGAQLRGLMAAEGLATGLVAALAGFAAGLALVPGPVTTTQVALALLAGLAPAVALATAASPRGLRAERSDLGTRSRSRLRWVVEVVVVAAAVVATWLLLGRGVVAGTSAPTSGGGLGVDPLLASAPLLLSLAATLLAVRAYPWLALAAERALARRRDLVPFLGAARATRDPAGGPVPAVALVLAVAVAASSTVLYATVSGGVAREAWHEVGADLRVSGPVVAPETVAALAALDGVEAVSSLTDLGQVPLRTGLAGERVQVYAVDGAALGEVQHGTAGGPRLLGELAGGGDELRAVASEGLAAAGVTVGMGGLELVGSTVAPLDVVETVDQVPGVASGERFLVVDADRAAELLDVSETSRIALLGLADGADAAAVAEQVRGLLPTAVVDDPDRRAAQILESPVSSGLAAAFLVAVALAGVLVAAAVAMTLMLAAPVRARLLAVLETLGLSGRQARGLVGWEIGPWTVVALLVGALLGVVVPWVVLAAVDVTALTGGAEQPGLVFDPLLLGAVGAGFVVVVGLGVVVAAALGRRGEVAAQLRMGEER
ncbi:hypothetical protein [Antribacter gilvus]|uniref:hypothetical protein n=1 Tax=Antribacter gilvus TaxID=2304675 RepID=UPI000F7B763B|nr:hypothetical protein [Antribacter gilvus]